MVVQNQLELGEGSANQTDPHHTPIIIQSLTQPQKTQKPRKPKRKDTQATPNESSSLGTTLGGGPRFQETMGILLLKLGQNENIVEEVVDVAQVSTVATTVTITTEEITLAQALKALKTSKPKVKGIVFQEQGKSTTTIRISSQQSHNKGKGILIEPVEPIKKKDLIRLDEEVALKLQFEFNEEERLARKKAKKVEEDSISLIETWDDIHAKIDADHQLAERLQA
ncbi:hypothetical protein Tco_1484821 [Tanacetum coccineum]